MRLVAVLAACAVVLCGGLDAAPAARYTLYYLDGGRNVCRVLLDSNAKPAGKTQRITSRGGYDGYSVSPDEKSFVGFTLLDSHFDADTQAYWFIWKCFVETLGGKPTRRGLRIEDNQTMDGYPQTQWSAKGSYFQLWLGAFDVECAPYSVRTGRPITAILSSPAVISRDERFLVVPEGTETHVLDLKSGAKAKLGDAFCYAVWVGDSHKLAWIKDFDELWLGEVKAAGTRLSIAGRTRLSGGPCDDLRYIPGKGLYFVEGREGRAAAYYSRDLKTLVKGKRLPSDTPEKSASEVLKGRKGVLAQYAEYSPDRRFIVCPVSAGRGKLPEIRIFDSAGRSHPVARGRMPHWKSAADVWSSWDAY